MDFVGDAVGEDAAAVGHRPCRAAVLLADQLRARGDVDEPKLDDDAFGRFADGADNQPLGVDFLPPLERHLLNGSRPRDRAQDVPRNHVELFLVREIVPQHVGDRLGCAHDLRLFAERYEFGDRHPRRAFRIARADDDADAARLRRLLLCWWWILRGQRDNRAERQQGSQKFHGFHQRL